MTEHHHVELDDVQSFYLQHQYQQQKLAQHQQLVPRIPRKDYYRNRFNYQIPELGNISKRLEDNSTEMCGSSPDYFDFFQYDYRHRSRLDEDKTIYNTFFRDIDDSSFRGSYVELGAFNGVQESNTRFFDVCLGWDGLLIEGNPHPKVWGELVSNRPHAHRMNFVPCTVKEEIANKTVTFHSKIWTNAGIEDSSVSNAYKGGTKATVEVPCGSMTQVLLDVFPQGRVSFFSLDVEGSEHLVLRAIDISQVFIEVIMVEVENKFCELNGRGDCTSRDDVRQQLRDAGYVRFSGYIHASDVHIHPKSEMLARAYAAGWKAFNETKYA